MIERRPPFRDVCVFGAGAVGGNVAVNLIRHTSARVSVVARGAHLEAIRSHGLRLRAVSGEVVAHPNTATDQPQRLPVQDLVIVTLKAPALPGTAQAIAGLLGPASCALFLTNGVPWWWNLQAPPADTIPLIDPAGALWDLVGPHRVVGGLVRSSNEVVEPGVVVHAGGNTWILGEPTGASTTRLGAVTDLMRQAGLATEQTGDIRSAVWDKLLTNATSAPISALTRLYSRDVRETADLDLLQRRLWHECAAVGRSLGLRVEGRFDDIPMPPPQSRPSMLQDVLAGRPTEVEAILGVPQYFARLQGVQTPTLDVVVALLRGLHTSATRPVTG